MTMRRCPACKQDKEDTLDNFYKRTGTSRVHTYCKPCYAARGVAYRKTVKDTPEFKSKRRFEQRKRRMGIDKDTFWKMFEFQSGICPICKLSLEEGTGKVHVDHDHKTGKIRDLLCRRCNIMIGLAQDNREILAAAIRYLEKHDCI
jgi:hypothetical protein